MVWTELAGKLKELRKSRKMTVRELSAMLGLKEETYRSYEAQRAEPSLFTLRKIAEIYNVSLDYLIGRVEADQDAYMKIVRVSPLLAKGIDTLSSENLALIEGLVVALGDREEQDRLMQKMREETGSGRCRKK